MKYRDGNHIPSTMLPATTPSAQSNDDGRSFLSAQHKSIFRPSVHPKRNHLCEWNVQSPIACLLVRCLSYFNAFAVKRRFPIRKRVNLMPYLGLSSPFLFCFGTFFLSTWCTMQSKCCVIVQTRKIYREASLTLKIFFVKTQ